MTASAPGPASDPRGGGGPGRGLPGTVSRVVNGSPKVSAAGPGGGRAGDRRARLRAQPGRPRLVTQRTDSVALVVSEPEDRVFAEPFFAGDRPRDQRRR